MPDTSIEPKPLKPYQMREYVLATVTKHKLPYESYKLLAEWLTCYQYIYPTHRELRIKPVLKITKPLDCITLHRLCDIYYSSMLGYEQTLFATNTGKGLVELCG